MKLSLLFVLCGSSLGWLLWSWCWAGTVAPGVTAAGIRRVRPGMTPNQVTAILGRPYRFSSIKGSNTHYAATCADFAATQLEVELTDTTDIAGLFRRVAADTTVHSCDTHDERKHDRNSTFAYSQPGGPFRTYPMLWVHFNQQARVSNVCAKEYAADDHCIYALAADTIGNMLDQTALIRLFDSGR